MRAIPGLLAKDGFEGVQLVALADGRNIALKMSDGADRARMPVAAEALLLLRIRRQALAAIRSLPVVGSRLVGLFEAIPANPQVSYETSRTRHR